VVDPVFAAPGNYGSLATWLAVLAYAGQIYGDFSGYSDMAIGLAHMFGFKIKPNFNMPYLAGNIAEFWQRWHISLSTWLRDYLYIPLGGNRNGPWATYRNLFITMLLGGLWHGASWTFVAWGLFHGSLLALHRAIFGQNQAPRSFPYRCVSVVATFLCVCVGWVFFRAASFGDACTILHHMAWPLAGSALASTSMLMVLACLGALAIGYAVGTLGNVARWLERLPATLVGALLAVSLLLTFLLIPEDGKLFIYFQF
jgi:alginate O-acetyltransferase complex protein AlgI